MLAAPVKRCWDSRQARCDKGMRLPCLPSPGLVSWLIAGEMKKLPGSRKATPKSTKYATSATNLQIGPYVISKRSKIHLFACIHLGLDHRQTPSCEACHRSSPGRRRSTKDRRAGSGSPPPSLWRAPHPPDSEPPLSLWKSHHLPDGDPHLLHGEPPPSQRKAPALCMESPPPSRGAVAWLPGAPQLCGGREGWGWWGPSPEQLVARRPLFWPPLKPELSSMSLPLFGCL